jgi:hypothetical protein
MGACECCSGEWVAAGCLGEGTVHAWLSGNALAGWRWDAKSRSGHQRLIMRVPEKGGTRQRRRIIDCVE